MDEYVRTITTKYTDAHIVPWGEEIPLELVELVERIRLCDGNCNECPLVGGHQNTLQLSLILGRANKKFGDEFYALVQSLCPNLTVCAECHVDDFVHVEGCSLSQFIEKDDK